MINDFEYIDQGFGCRPKFDLEFLFFNVSVCKDVQNQKKEKFLHCFDLHDFAKDAILFPTLKTLDK